MTYVVKRPERIFGDLDRVFNSVFDTTYSLNSRNPVVDISESSDGYTLEVELPGMSEKDVEVKVENNRLLISSVSEEEKKDGEKNDQTRYILRERRSLSFSRAFVLPKDADADSISGTFTNGILTIAIAKKPETKPRSIKIKAA